jgi:preprotein translocase subunit YajC
VSELASLLPLVAIALLFWLLLIRPASKRQREVRQMQASLAVGDEVMLTSGIYGVLRSLDDDRVQAEIAPGVVVEVARGAVGQRVQPSAGVEPERTADSTDTTNTTDTTDTETTEER